MLFSKKIFDLPRIGPYLRNKRYEKIFDSILPGEIAIDCGANVGKVTKKLIEKGVKVYAFEPDPNAFKVLRNNLSGHKVVLINKAVSDHSGVTKIYFSSRYEENPIKWSTGSSLIEDKPNVDRNKFAICEIVDLSEFIQNLEEKIGLLKMDIEGEEVKVLNKLIDLDLVDKIRNIVVETHERIPSLKGPTELLRNRIKKLHLKNIDLDWA